MGMEGRVKKDVPLNSSLFIFYMSLLFPNLVHTVPNRQNQCVERDGIGVRVRWKTKRRKQFF